jgi:hypothetical protein
MYSLEDHKIRKSAKVRQEVHKSQDRQVSRSQNLKNLEDWQTIKVKKQKNNL